ncbi:MAG: hypothetical protein RLY97_2277 [Pseudomonadota bacterium]
MHKPTKYVLAIYGTRDSYQVPLALAEVGLLERYVTDFYAPSGPLARFLPKPMRRRRVDGLPRQQTRSLWHPFLVNSAARALRLPMMRIFAYVGGYLAKAALREAEKSQQALYCYHNYVPDKLPENSCLIVFVYHPLASADYAVLAADNANYPETAESFARETYALNEFEQKLDWDQVTAVVCASSFTAKSVIHDGCDPDKITIVPYGLPEVESPVAIQSAEKPIRKDGPAEFLFVGQGVQRKGLHHLIRAWQSAPRNGARLTLVSYQIDSAIASLITDPSIRLLGYQTREELDAVFAASDIFIMPSLVEGFGLVYVEALAQGCHVIGTANTGLPDLHLDDGAHSLVEPGNIAALSEIISKTQARAEAGEFDRSAIIKAGHAWTHTHFRQAIAEHAAQVLRDFNA